MVVGSRQVYFAGDTGLFASTAEIACALDVALVPVRGWFPTATLGHLDPRRAAEALRLLKPLLAIPIHWGTYPPLGPGRAMSFLNDPPQAFRRHAAELAPEVEVRVLSPGEMLWLDTIAADPA